jgi:hypothetical protein
LFPQSSKDPAFIPTLLGFLGGKFLVEPTETGVYSIEVYSERIAGRADPYVLIQDEKGKA